MAPKSMIFMPVWASSPPKEEEGSKKLTSEGFNIVNHETHILARNRKTIHPAREMCHLVILRSATKACLQEETHGVLTEANSRATKKLATRRKAGEEWTGLTKQLKCCETKLPNLTPGSKHKSESPAMVEGLN
jgi:hypothetical protein